MAGGAEPPNIAALPAITRLRACESARDPEADRHVKLLIQFALEGSLSGAYSHSENCRHTTVSKKRRGAPDHDRRRALPRIPEGPHAVTPEQREEQPDRPLVW